MRKRSLLLTLLTLSWLAASACAQENPGRIVDSNKRKFNIPFSLPAEKLRSLNLFVSTDQGRNWSFLTTALPEQGRFYVTVADDGEYWFTVQTIDMENIPSPASMRGAKPYIRVLVDTQPPRVNLQPLPAKGGDIGVKWEIIDDNLDLFLPDAVRLEYRLPGSTTWVQVAPAMGAHQHYWNPQTTSAVEVRLKARDKVGNWGEATIAVGGLGNHGNPPGFNGQPSEQPRATPDPPANNVVLPSDVERKFVNSLKITLNYELKDVGPSGVSQVEIWYTLDGRTWNPYELKFGSDLSQKSVTFPVAREGLYGISLIARSGVGLGAKPPQAGERPQIWIEVDTTKPVVQLHNVLVGQGADKGKITITWSARDKNLQPEPIVLSYAKELTGPWTPITTEKLANTGRYVWGLPPDIPYQFYVKVEASDRARNVGEATTTDMVRVDLSLPRVNILEVQPADK